MLYDRDCPKENDAALFQDKGTSIITNKHTFDNHPTLRLLQYLKNTHNFRWTKCHFDDIILGRWTDLDMKQYPDMDSMVQHALWSCGSLSQLVLESAGYPNSGATALFHTERNWVLPMAWPMHCGSVFRLSPQREN